MERRYSIVELSRGVRQKGGRRIMALLRSYFDVSLTTKAGLAERITCVGGFVGQEEQWLQAEREWKATLALWGIEEFHLTRILAGEVYPVGRERAEECVLSFVKIMQRAKLTGIVAGLRDDDWLTVEKSPDYARRFPTSYHAALHTAFELLEDYLRLEYPEDDFEVYADLDSESPEANAIRDELRANPRCANVAFVRRRRIPLIQCADLCAGLARKEWLENGFMPRKRLTKLQMAAHAYSGRGSFWSLETAKYIADVMEQQAKRRAENAARASSS